MSKGETEPTQGDTARQELLQRRLLWFQDVTKELTEGLPQMNGTHRAVFAVAAAERVMRAHEALSPAEQRSYSLSWRPVLDSIWRGLEGDDSAYYDVSKALGEFYLSPENHIEGPEGPQGADEDAAAASIFAALCFIHGCADFALVAASRASDAAFYQAQDDREWVRRNPGMSEFAAQLAHPLHQEELARQLRDLHLLRESRHSGTLINEGPGPSMLSQFRS